MFNETPCPVMALDIPEVRVAGKYVLVDNTVILAVNTVPAMHTIGKPE